MFRGESGMGKELFVYVIYNVSSWKFNKFVWINCVVFFEFLFESEFFGYEEGVFFGVKRGGKCGVFEEVNNGSIFLDEIGEFLVYM